MLLSTPLQDVHVHTHGHGAAATNDSRALACEGVNQERAGPVRHLVDSISRSGGRLQEKLGAMQARDEKPFHHGEHAVHGGKAVFFACHSERRVFCGGGIPTLVSDA